MNRFCIKAFIVAKLSLAEGKAQLGEECGFFLFGPECEDHLVCDFPHVMKKNGFLGTGRKSQLATNFLGKRVCRTQFVKTSCPCISDSDCRTHDAHPAGRCKLHSGYENDAEKHCARDVYVYDEKYYSCWEEL